MGLTALLADVIPKSDENNHYIPYFALNIFSWTSFIHKLNLSLFREDLVRDKLTTLDYERVLLHVDRCTRRTRRLMEAFLYLWLVVAFFPGYTITPLEGLNYFFTNWIATLLKIYIIGAPIYFFYYVYGKKENLITKVQLALDELNDREFHHRGCSWSVDSSGKFMRVQLNFTHLRDALRTRSQNLNSRIEVPEIVSSERKYRYQEEEDMMDAIRGKKTHTLRQPLI